MSCRRLCSSCWSCGDESGGLCEGGSVVADCWEGRRRRMRPGELEGGTAIVSGLVMSMGELNRQSRATQGCRGKPQLGRKGETISIFQRPSDERDDKEMP
jgi:hypothetical protein